MTDKYYNRIEWIKRIVTYPIRLVFLPWMALVGWCITDWTDREDREHNAKMMKALYKL